MILRIFINDMHVDPQPQCALYMMAIRITFVSELFNVLFVPCCALRGL